MRQLVLAMCCAAVVGLLPPCAFGQSYGALYGQRPEPPIEPSVLIVEKPATAATTTTAEPVAPKPVVRQKIVRRVISGPSGPVTMPPADILVIMVRGALAAVNQANFTENYSVLHGMTTPALQARVSASRFGKAFAALRQQHLDMSPVLIMPPQFTATPALTPEGVLRLTGFFPSRPLRVVFAIDYRAVGGFWLIDALSVSTQPADIAASAANPAPSTRQTTSATAETPLTQRPLALVRSGFWQPRFIKATQFGPVLRFAANPQ